MVFRSGPSSGLNAGTPLGPLPPVVPAYSRDAGGALGERRAMEPRRRSARRYDTAPRTGGCATLVLPGR